MPIRINRRVAKGRREEGNRDGKVVTF